MTLQEAIAKIDDLKPNQYKVPHKISWISDIDGRVYHEIIKKHKDYECENCADKEWSPYDENTDMSLKLLIDDPYSNIYLHYMAAMIDYWNGEFTRYNNDIQLFNDEFQSYDI